jgi:hypothetical protein
MCAKRIEVVTSEVKNAEEVKEIWARSVAPDSKPARRQIASKFGVFKTGR